MGSTGELTNADNAMRDEGVGLGGGEGYGVSAYTPCHPGRLTPAPSVTLSYFRDRGPRSPTIPIESAVTHLFQALVTVSSLHHVYPGTKARTPTRTDRRSASIVRMRGVWNMAVVRHPYGLWTIESWVCGLVEYQVVDCRVRSLSVPLERGIAWMYAMMVVRKRRIVSMGEGKGRSVSTQPSQSTPGTLTVFDT